MKLSNREKVLIGILIIVVIAYFGFKYIPSLNLFNLDSLREQYIVKSNDYNNMSQNIVSKTKYEENVQTLTEEINNLNVVSDLQQEKLIVFLNNYFANNNIDANNINFTDAVVVPVNTVLALDEPEALSSFEAIINDINGASQLTQTSTESSKTEAEKQSSGSPEKSSSSVRSISANVTFTGTYENMIKFIDAIQNNPVDISITNISTVSTENDILQGTINLNFYEVPKPEGFMEDNGEWIWKDLAQYGKDNPFAANGAWTSLSGSTGSNFDFFINLEPESSDLPTVLIGKTEDSSRSTYLSENNNSVESVEFSFKSENNKYYYSYNTKNNSYPKNGAWQEFTPTSSENITIKINSRDRSSKTDSVGAIIGVNNSTGLKVSFEIENDNSTKPRVTFKDAKSVIVTRR
jgi:type IV pilus assembly protein PilO